jgi:hypothetical protein
MNMRNVQTKAIKIPNWILVAFAAVLAASAAKAYFDHDRTGAITMLGGCGIFLGALSFSFPALPIWAKALLTPVLLAPFVVLILLLLQVL